MNVVPCLHNIERVNVIRNWHSFVPSWDSENKRSTYHIGYLLVNVWEKRKHKHKDKNPCLNHIKRPKVEAQNSQGLGQFLKTVTLLSATNTYQTRRSSLTARCLVCYLSHGVQDNFQRRACHTLYATSWLPPLAWKTRKMRHVQNTSTLSLSLEMPATRARQNNQTEGGKPSPALGICELFHHVIFRPIKRLKFIGNLFSEKSAKLYSGFSRRNSTVVITIYFWIVCFEAVVRELGDISNNRLKLCGHFRNKISF